MNSSSKRHPGRPRLDPSGEPSAAVHLKLTGTDYDRASAIAKQARVSVQDLLRTGLKKLIDERGNSV